MFSFFFSFFLVRFLGRKRVFLLYCSLLKIPTSGVVGADISSRLSGNSGQKVLVVVDVAAVVVDVR